jgi:hypothetical protein
MLFAVFTGRGNYGTLTKTPELKTALVSVQPHLLTANLTDTLPRDDALAAGGFI